VLGPSTSPETYALIGAFLEVHKELGPGYLESAYGDALELELSDRCIPALREVPLHVTYKRRELKTRYRADFLVNGRILVEMKAQSALTPIDEAQVIHYLKTMGLRVALLVNFGAKSCEVRRFVGPEVEGQDVAVEFV
jgi:GxxExxY protein